MPYSTTVKQYTLRVPPDYAGTGRFTALWGVYTRHMDEDEEMHAPDEHTGKDYHAYFRVEVGPHNAGRRKVRISAWMAPTFDIAGDTTYTGMAMDQGNESEIEMGALVPFNFKEIDAPSPGGGRQILFSGMTLFVEWNAMDPHELLFVPTIEMPLAYMQIIPRGSDILCPHRQKTLNDNLHKYKLDQSPIPARPASPPRAPLVHDRALVPQGRSGRPKRAREGVESVSQ
jgi:hypothetical protein